MNKTEQLKSEGKYIEAGANAWAAKEGRAYGCHYGMRSDRAFAMNEFYRGYDEADENARKARKEGMANNG